MTVPVNEENLQHVFERFGVNDFQTRGDVREFAQMDVQSQLVWLFLAVQTKKGSVKGHLLNAVYATGLAILYAALAYAGVKPLQTGGE